MPHADPVTPQVRMAVLRRDRYACVAPAVDDDVDLCRDRWGRRVTFDSLTLDHVQEGYGKMGQRAPSDERHLVTLCWHHHLDGWATGHRPALRRYLRSHPPVPGPIAPSCRQGL